MNPIYHAGPAAILGDIETALRVARMSPSRFGRWCAGDPRLVFDLQRGRRPTPSTERRIQAAIATLLTPGA
jgi:hypothetical protein